jgi:outer membrane receptor for ferrienterochelin and colicin
MKQFAFICAFVCLPVFLVAQQLDIKVLSLVAETPVAGIPVYLDNQNTGETIESVTDSTGSVRFTSLNYGSSYVVFTSNTDLYQFTSLPAIRLEEGGPFSFVVRAPEVRSAMLGEVLISSSSMARMNTQNATVSGQLKNIELRRIPIEGRDVTRGLYRLPNVTVAVLGYAEGPNISINGLNGIFTNYLIDGMDNNERFLGNMKLNTPVGFVENVTVLTNNYSAEWGNSSNGIVNVLSRSGTNEVSGEVFYLTRPGSIVDAPSDFATLDLYGNPVKDGFQRHQFGFSIGAPIKKDKTFIYLNAEQTIDIKDNLLVSNELNVNETVRGNNYFTYLSGKVDHLWSKNFQSSLRAQVGQIYNERQGGGLEGGVNFPSAASAQDNDTYMFALRNQIRVNARLSTEVNYQHSYFRWNYRQPVNPNDPSVTLRNPAGQSIAVIGQSGSIFDDKEYTHQVQNKWFYRAGDHTLKAGVEFITSDFQLLGGGNPNGSYILGLNEDQIAEIRNSGVGSSLGISDIPTDVEVIQYEVELRPTTFGARQNVVSAYVEDSWRVTNRLTANAGLRWDYDNLSKSGGDQGDLDNIAPRLSLNYQLTEKSVIRGGYGIFYDKIKYSVYSDALQFSSTSADFRAQLTELQRLGILDPGANLDQITFNGNLRATAPGVTFPNGPSSEDLGDRREDIFSNNLRILNPNGWDNPYSHQFSLGFQTKPNDQTIFIVDGVHTRTENLYVIRNLNAPPPYLFPEGVDAADVVARSRAQADAERPIPVFSNDGFYSIVQGDTLRGGSRNVFMSETAGRATYYALNFMLHRELGSSKLGYRLLYTLSYTKSNTSSINTRAHDSNDFEADFNWDENDRRHVMSGVVFYEPIRNLLIAPAALIQSGQPITRVAGAGFLDQNGNPVTSGDLNGDGESFGLPSDFWPGETKNQDRLPWATTFDLSVKYLFQLKSRTSIEVSADVFNVFNTQNWSGFNTTRGVSNQTQVGPPDSYSYVLRSASPPRQFQFGARYIF